MKLILNNHVKYHVSDDTVREFEKIILSDPFISSILPYNKYIAKIAYYFWRLFKGFGIEYNPLCKFNILKMRREEKRPYYFAVLMGFDYLKCMPYFLLPFRKSVYIFDAWPAIHLEIRQFVKYFEVERVFLSSSQATERLKNTVGNTQFYWVPEGINPEEYRYYPYKKKNIDVLAFGRKYDTYHEKIKDTLESDKRIYLYEKFKSEVIFKTREEFIDGLARSKVSICVPSSITHPERSGDIETMTIRYLQSMVSKCLIVGHAPNELITCFGYNPVIEIDMEDPVNQIKEIIINYSDYIDLIEKNFTNVLQSHTWSHRWQIINDILNK